MKNPKHICEDCERGVKLSADGSNHIFGEKVGDVRPCKEATKTLDREPARAFARMMANSLNVAFVIYEVRDASGVEYAVRRAGCDIPHQLFKSKWKEVERFAPTTLASEPEGENVSRETSSPVLDAPHELFVDFRLPSTVAASCPCGWTWETNVSDIQPKDEAERKAARYFELHVATSVKLTDVSRETSSPVLAWEHEITLENVPRSDAVEARCSCGKWSYRYEPDDSDALANLEDAEKSVREAFAAHVLSVAHAPDVSHETLPRETREPETVEPLSIELEYAEASAHESAGTVQHPDEEPRSKKEQIIALYESGVTDIAQIVRKVAARPSYVAQVLQGAGLITGYFDLYTTTAREQNVYSRFFRNVLDFKTVERAQESVKRIGRLYDYFERLGDRAGQHQAMVLALTGKNRARWSGKFEESEVFSEWLNTH